jgi:hypothetical protein
MGQKLPAYWSEQPDSVIFDLHFVQNGGDVRDERITRIRQRTLDAFHAACEAEKMDSTSSMRMQSVSKRKFLRMLVSRLP